LILLLQLWPSGGTGFTPRATGRAGRA